MSNGHVINLLKRYDGNPILTSWQWPYSANTVFNAGATLLDDGDTLLLVRVEDRRGISHLTAVRSHDGMTEWRIDPAPTMVPNESPGSDELYGIEDPRIVYLPEMERYSILYTAYSESGPHVKLALTKDFVHFERIGSVLPPEDKDASLFPRRLGGMWHMIHRPVSASAGSADMWISCSPDLIHWGRHQVMLPARRGAWWDANRIGLSPPPVETAEGWLVFYHGVRITPAGCIYRLGVALFDLEDPRKLISRGSEWILGPEQDYEQIGDVPDVVFPCGSTVCKDGDTLRIYYGAADSSVALATGSIREILDWLKCQV